MTEVNAIVYIDHDKRKINEGLSGVSGLVGGSGMCQELMSHRFTIPSSSSAHILYMKTISFTVFADPKTVPEADQAFPEALPEDTPDESTAFSHEEEEDRELRRRMAKYEATKVMTVVVMLERNRIAGIPYFSTDALDKGRVDKARHNKEVEDIGNFVEFHIGGPMVNSDDNSTSFSMNENEMSTIDCCVTVLFNFVDEDRKAYKKILADKP